MKTFTSYLKTRVLSACASIALFGLLFSTPSHAQILWDTANSNGSVGNGVSWSDSGNWIGGVIPLSTQDISLNGGTLTVDTAAVYKQLASGTGSITITSGGSLTTYGSTSAVRYASSVNIGAGGSLVDGNDDSAVLRSNVLVATDGRIDGFQQVRDNAIMLNGGTLAPLGTDFANLRNFDINAAGEIQLNSGVMELDAFGNNDVEYFRIISSTGVLNLSGGSGGKIVLVPQDGYVPEVGHAYDLWNQTVAGLLTTGDASNVSIRGYTTVFNTSLWASSGQLTITSVSPISSNVIYASDFQTNRVADFYSYPASFHHEAAVTYPGTETGAMVFGAPGESFASTVLRVAVQPSKAYEVITRTAITGTGSNTADQFVQLLDASGNVLYTSPDLNTGDHQVILPVSGVTPAGTAWVQIKWVLRGLVASGTSRRIEIAQVAVTELGASGPRPFLRQDPYINHTLGYVGQSVSVDMADSFVGNVASYTNDAGIPMTTNGAVVTFTPTSTRPHKPSFMLYAQNSAGVSLGGAEVYLQVDATPSTLSARAPDPAVLAQYVRQYVEPGQTLFPIDCDQLFDGGLPPYSNAFVSKPSWVEMPVNGLVGGRCPSGATPLITSIVVRRTDARGNIAQYTLNVNVIAPRSRVPTHTPATSAALTTAMGSGANVIQLQAGVTYTPGNLYGAGLLTTSAANPVIILGAPGAKITSAGFNDNGHYILENVAFELTEETTALLVKKTRGMRLLNCTFKGILLPVDLNDGKDWVRTDTFRYAGKGIISREGAFVIIDGCHFSHFNTSLNTMVNARSFGVFNTVSEAVADDHCFFQQATALWMENTDLLGHVGNHTSGEHRDVIQLANPNQPPMRKVLFRRVFGYGDGKSQGAFIENEDQRIVSDRIPYWTGNHRDLLMEHCVFVGNSVHGISLRGLLGYEVRNCLTVGNPDETHLNNGVNPAYVNFLIRPLNQNGIIQNNISDKLEVEDVYETANTNNTLLNHLAFDSLPGGYVPNRAAILPSYGDTSKTMKQRLKFDPTWATNNPNLGPDILR